MPTALWDDIQAQSQNIQQVIDHLYGPEYNNLKNAAAFVQPGKPIVFIGMTSAAYLCHPAEHYLCSQGRLATVMQASDALYSLLPALQGANVIINSRSGETAEIIKLAEALHYNQVPFLAVTNEPGSTLAGYASRVLWTHSRKDDLVSINIITAMMTATLVLAAEIMGKSVEIQQALKRLPGWVEGAVETAWAQADTLLAWFRDTNPIYLLHRGASRGAANCARLVLEEVGRRPAIAMEAGEFRQGPIEVVDQNFGAVIYVAEGPTGELNCRLADDVQLQDGRVYVVGNGVLCSHDHAQQFPVSTEAGIFQSVLEVIPSQILAYKLAEAQGWEPGSVRYISKIITTESGIPGKQPDAPGEG